MDFLFLSFQVGLASLVGVFSQSTYENNVLVAFVPLVSDIERFDDTSDARNRDL